MSEAREDGDCWTRSARSADHCRSISHHVELKQSARQRRLLDVSTAMQLSPVAAASTPHLSACTHRETRPGSGLEVHVFEWLLWPRPHCPRTVGREDSCLHIRGVRPSKLHTDRNLWMNCDL